jgi:protein-tyrosine phosphatase
MIDLHSHILHGLDDGPATFEESVALAAAYAQAGFTRVVATPHYMPGTAWTPRPEEIVQAVAWLNAALRRGRIGLRVYTGMEIALDGRLDHLLEANALVPLAQSRWLLVELPFERLPLGWDRMLFRLAAQGWQVLLAHPERCRQFTAQPALAEESVQNGLCLQANGGSFLGLYGPDAARAAFGLLEKGCLHVLGTDSHDTRQRHPGVIREALRVLEAAAGPETARVLTRDNPERVLKGLPLERPAPAAGASRKGKSWRLF